MEKDYGYDIIDVEELYKTLDSFKDKMVYLKSYVKGIGYNDEFAVYNKMKVNECVDSITHYYLYGAEERDQILINKKHITQCEKKVDEKGIHIKVVIGYEGTSIYIYLHDCGMAVI